MDRRKYPPYSYPLRPQWDDRYATSPQHRPQQPPHRAPRYPTPPEHQRQPDLPPHHQDSRRPPGDYRYDSDYRPPNLNYGHPRHDHRPPSPHRAPYDPRGTPYSSPPPHPYDWRPPPPPPYYSPGDPRMVPPGAGPWNPEPRFVPRPPDGRDPNRYPRENAPQVRHPSRDSTPDARRGRTDDRRRESSRNNSRSLSSTRDKSRGRSESRSRNDSDKPGDRESNESRESKKRKRSSTLLSPHDYLSDNDPDEIEPQINIEEEMKKLTASYNQCTQHGNLYKRVLNSEYTVEGTEKLVEIYDRFEEHLVNRHRKLWKPNTNVLPEATQKDVDEEINVNQSTQITVKKVENWNHTFALTRHQRAKSRSTIIKLSESAKKEGISLSEYINKKQPSVPNFCLGKLKKALQGIFDDEDSLEDGELEVGDQAGELISSIRKLKAHPDRLHDELWYNEPGQANDGPLCRCRESARVKGIRHNIYPGEVRPPSCHPMKTKLGQFYHYRVAVGPPTNFMISSPTTIEHGGHDFFFEGFSIFSHEKLDHVPFCDIIRFHIRYTIYLIPETPPENFCMRGMDLFHDYLFREILELYDWAEREYASDETTEQNFRKFRFYPRFVRSLPDNGKEFLSLCKVLEYLMESDKPLVDEKDLDHLMGMSHKEWLNFTDKVRGMIVTHPGKKPSSLRVDQLDRYDRTPVESQSNANHPVDDRFPMIVHFGIRPANLSYAGDPTYQRTWRAYLKLRHLMANSPNVKSDEKKKLRERERALQKIRRDKDMQREVTVELSSKGFRRTGIFSDICQHAMLLPVLTHHLRYHLCLESLEKSIGYQFKERKWLSHAMNHPSCQMNFGLNPDHVRNALSNCGLRLPKYGDSSIHYKYTRKRGITTLIRIMARLGQQRPVLSPIEHNERLEFLGDAVVGYYTSVHLFLMFPDLSEGALTTFRTVLVNNQHLATLAERLRLDEYMLYAHGPDLCRKADLRHAMANCFEALMGAIYMEAGLEIAQDLFGKFLWETPKLQGVWKHLALHPLQEEEPVSDRRCIQDVPILQKLTEFEDKIGVTFNHIRILAKAFTWRNVHENILTKGHNQRLEFLGDSICNLVASTYLFRLYPTHHEGHLTLLRATVVNGRTQSMVATELGMPHYVICNLDSESPGGKVPEWKEKNLADLLEAFVASLYVDKGLKYVEGFMQVCFFPRLKEFILSQEWNDPKSCLQQCCLTLRQEGKEPQLPTYEISKQAGPSHARKYLVSVFFRDKAIGKGSGESIQKAEREAARNALQEYNFPQLEWQRRYVAEKHDLPYQPRKNLKKIEAKKHEKENSNVEPAGKRPKMESQ